MQAVSLPRRWKDSVAAASSKLKRNLYEYLDRGLPMRAPASQPVPSAPQISNCAPTPNIQGLSPGSSNLPRNTIAFQDNSLMPLDESDPRWVPDDAFNACMKCDIAFNMFERRHHCRYCGLLLCRKCSEGVIKSLRACEPCVSKARMQRSRTFSAIQVPGQHSMMPTPSAPPMESSPVVCRAEAYYVGDSEGPTSMPVAVAEAIPIPNDNL